jgi:hypothetical protein
MRRVVSLNSKLLCLSDLKPTMYIVQTITSSLVDLTAVALHNLRTHLR